MSPAKKLLSMFFRLTGPPPQTGPIARETTAGYDLVIVEEGKPISFDPPTKRVGLVASSSVPLAVGADGTRYVAAIRARTASGCVSEAAELRIPLVASGGKLYAKPNAPYGVTVQALADGDVLLTWQHTDMGSAVAAYQFKVFGDGGSGTINEVTALATATQWERSVTLSGLATNVRHRLIVRAYSAAGYHDGGCSVVVVVPRNSPPAGLASGALSASVT